MTIHVLIVEDNTSKSEHIQQIVESNFDATAEWVPTISGAYAVLSRQKWDLVILDMTFQVSQGLGQAVKKEALAGIELLQFMSAKQLSYPVVVATQHDFFSHGGGLNIGSIEHLHKLLSDEFPKQYRSTVQVDLASSEWHAKLLKAMRRALNG